MFYSILMTEFCFHKLMQRMYLGTKSRGITGTDEERQTGRKIGKAENQGADS